MVASMARLVLPAACAMATAAVLLAVAAPADGSVVESIITQDVYSAMLPNLHNSSCPASGFYTYDAFIQAAAFFPGFGTTGGGDEYNRRELAAFFGQTSHVTGGTRGAADQFQWGYCFKEEVNKSTSPPYYGRGPSLLTWQANYQQAGDALGLDLVGNPDLVSSDPVISFKTAIWFWWTAQGKNEPSCHDVVVENWTPSHADPAAGRVPGYGVITNIFNGGLECGRGPNDANIDRIGYYQRYCDMFDVAAGDNLDCYTQEPF